MFRPAPVLVALTITLLAGVSVLLAAHKTQLGGTPECAAVASAARAAAQSIGAPPPVIGTSGTGVILVFRESHLLLSSSVRDWSVAQSLGGREIGSCMHDGDTRKVWSVPGLPPGFASGIGEAK